ncbi:putative E3 ubiquitin-protein ligase BAH1-like 1 [Ananas comosus]|uniref:Putative E3 ubiquitin-protein ligase BAH1-like 1 n=1 Tax=Ananas comosus TaxID=4615 RepID=A0A199URY9_ANACO|nr:putative E3 ubiquitin-protein ligase BAH1-like 1 [Ananas comosus]
MKFAKKYEEYMKGKEEELPTVGLKKLKKMLKRCRSEFQEHHQKEKTNCSRMHAVCDGSFFPSLLEEMSAVVGCFNRRAKRLLEFHLASGFKKYLLRFLFRFHSNHGALIKEGKDLVTYAIVHYSKKGQAFKARAQSLRIEILQSPWLCELMAFYINLRRSEKTSQAAMELFGDCALTFDEDKPTLSCGLFDSMRVDINLTCSICLDTVFDPVALACGHIFCYMCCCSAASVTIVDGLESANPKAKCPLCRRGGVFARAVHLDELYILLRHSCSDYWEKRLRIERVERVRQAKQHWELQCRAIMGI